MRTWKVYIVKKAENERPAEKLYVHEFRGSKRDLDIHLTTLERTTHRQYTTEEMKDEGKDNHL